MLFLRALLLWSGLDRSHPQSTPKRPLVRQEWLAEWFETYQVVNRLLFGRTPHRTPFAADDRPVKGRALDIRGKCPLELAGYDVSRIPLAHLSRGQILGWPPETIQELAQNV